MDTLNFSITHRTVFPCFVRAWTISSLLSILSDNSSFSVFIATTSKSGFAMNFVFFVFKCSAIAAGYIQKISLVIVQFKLLLDGPATKVSVLL